MADLKDALPKTWSSPTMSPHCADETKYGVVDAVVKHFEAMQNKGREGRGPEDPRSRHRQRRARHGRGRQLGPGAGVIQQAGTGGGGREPGLASSACATCSRRWIRCCAPIPKSASTIRRFESCRVPGAVQYRAQSSYAARTGIYPRRTPWVPALRCIAGYAAAPRPRMTTAVAYAAAGTGSAVTDLIFSIAKREVTFFSGTAPISFL